MTDNLAVQGATACVCLLAVMLLILGAARIARRIPALGVPARAEGPLSLVASLALDRSNRLHLVQVGTSRTLVLTGSAAATVIELRPAS